MPSRDDRRDWDFDDWSVEPENPAHRLAPPAKESAPLLVDDWLAGEPVSEEPSRPSSLDKAGLAVAALLVVLFGGLAIAGVFTSKHQRPPAAITTTPRSAVTTTANSAAASAAPTSTVRGGVTVPTTTLKPGDTGSQVSDLQQTLSALGYLTGTVDGNYGPATQSAVARFQRASGLTADGVFGSQTLSVLSRTAG